MQNHYCRYCRRTVRMPDKAVKAYRRLYDTPLPATPLAELYRPVRELIAEITSTGEFEVDEVLRRHRLKRWQR